MQVLVTDKRSGHAEWMSLEKAAELMQIDPHEIAWALEEFGECEAEDHIATQPD